MNWKLLFNFGIRLQTNKFWALFFHRICLCVFPFNFHFVIFHSYTPFPAIFSRKLIFLLCFFSIYCWNIFLHVAEASLNGCWNTDFKYVMLLLITNMKVNTFSIWWPPSPAPRTLACWRWQPQFAWATPFSHIDRQFFSISLPAMLKFHCRGTYCVCISLLYIVYTFYSISIWTVNNAAGWAKWRRRCLASSPASALNSLTISTIKMCQKIFQFPYTTQEGK